MSEPIETPPPPPPPAPPSEPPPPDEPEARPGNAWERRDELGFVQGLIEATKNFVTAPGDTFAQTRKSGDMGSPILYAVILCLVMSIVGQIWSLMLGTSMLSMMPSEYREALPFLAATSGFSVMATIFVVPIMTLIWVFLGSAILHVMLMLVGGLDGSDSGFEGTLRVVAYSSVAQLGQIIPGVGGMITTIWMIVLLVIGLTRLQGTSDGKAVAAVLLPSILCCVCIGAMVVFGVGAAMSGLAN